MGKVAVFSVLFLGCVFGHPTSVKREGKVQVIQQKLDHVSGDPGFFDMKYIVYDEFFKPGGPVFISVSWQPGRGMYGTIFEDLSREMNGYYIEMDNRLHQNKTDFDLKHVSVDQILDDFAYLIQHLKTSVSGLENSKVFVIGRYDRGMLAPWLRKKHPEVCDGSWACEAPVEARATVDGFFDTIGEMVKRHGSDMCYDRIQEAFVGINAKFAKKEAQSLKELFELCDDFKLPVDEKAFFTSMTHLLSDFPRWHPRSVKATCEAMTKPNTDAVSAFAQVMKQFREKSPFSSCLPNSYEKLKEFYRTAPAEYDLYMMCHEFGGFKTGVSGSQPFSTGLDGDWYAQLCSDVFDKSITLADIERNVDAFNKRFGGKNPNFTNAFYSTGEYSPFYSQAVTQDLSDSVQAYVDQGEERAFVFQSLTAEGVSDALRQGQLRAIDLIRKWNKA